MIVLTIHYSDRVPTYSQKWMCPRWELSTSSIKGDLSVNSLRIILIEYAIGDYPYFVEEKYNCYVKVL